MNDLVTINELPLLLHVSKSYCQKKWPLWIEYGVKPIRIGRAFRGKLLFRRTEIEKMLDAWRVVN